LAQAVRGALAGGGAGWRGRGRGHDDDRDARRIRGWVQG
jgi:hypothetical protein